MALKNLLEKRIKMLFKGAKKTSLSYLVYWFEGEATFLLTSWFIHVFISNISTNFGNSFKILKVFSLY
ncbi:Uncharacterised protein [Mycobacteroides abscessus subsp. abscessus]|nr:Uncharacterised protein [Mycobacteroides abscessus subsp. abscessus]